MSGIGLQGRRARPRVARPLRILAAVIVVAGSVVAGGGSPAAAEEVPGGTFSTITNGLAVNGNLLAAGNGLLTCGPTCGLHTGAGGSTNNNVDMQYVDVDADPATFNSSSAALTVPAGARVAKVWLMWQGLGFIPPSTPANAVCQAGQAFRQPVALADVLANQPLVSLDGGVYQSIGVADFTSTLPVAAMSLVNAAVDVTDELANLTGGTHLVTVANLSTSRGFACTAGWALHVAYDYDRFVPGNPDSALRLVYTGFGSASVFNSTQTVTFGGFQTAAQGATLIVTATDGEPAGGDTVNLAWPTGSQPLANPLGSTTNVFQGIMTGAVSYAAGVSNAAFRNGNMDSWPTTAANLPAGSTSVDFRFVSSGDGYQATGVSMAIPVAQISITKTNEDGSADAQIVGPGSTTDTPVFRIAVQNDSAVQVSNASIEDPAAESCSLDGTALAKTDSSFAVGVLAPGAQLIVVCRGRPAVAGDANYSNTATATGVDPNGAPVAPVSDTSEVYVAGMTVAKSAEPPVVVSGANVTWTMQVLNTGGTDLPSVILSDTDCTGTVSEPSGPGAASGVLAQGDQWTYTCTEPVTAAKTNIVRVEAVPSTTVAGVAIAGAPLVATADATVQLLPAASSAAAASELSASGPGHATGWLAMLGLLLIGSGALVLRTVHSRT